MEFHTFFNQVNMKSLSIQFLTEFKRDARHFQLIYLSAFLFYGMYFLKWDMEIINLTTIIVSTCVTQLIWLFLLDKDLTGLKSGLITALGLCLLLKSTSLLTLSIAGSIAISAKYILRYNGKHLFNPANFGIIISITLFQDAWISPGQWGSDALFLFVLTILGGFILHKIGRFETSLVFLLTLFVLEYSRTVLYQGWEFEVLIHKFSNGTLLLFTFFMITDPMTIPNNKRARIIWSVIIAVATFIVSAYMQIYTAPVWVLFFMTPITVWLDNKYKTEKYEWINK